MTCKWTWNHVQRNISRGTELVSFSAVFSFIERIHSISRASSMNYTSLIKLAKSAVFEKCCCLEQEDTPEKPLVWIYLWFQVEYSSFQELVPKLYQEVIHTASFSFLLLQHNILGRRNKSCTCECVTAAGCKNFKFSWITLYFKCLVLLSNCTKTSCFYWADCYRILCATNDKSNCVGCFCVNKQANPFQNRIHLNKTEDVLAGGDRDVLRTNNICQNLSINLIAISV